MCILFDNNNGKARDGLTMQNSQTAPSGAELREGWQVALAPGCSSVCHGARCQACADSQRKEYGAQVYGGSAAEASTNGSEDGHPEGQGKCVSYGEPITYPLDELLLHASRRQTKVQHWWIWEDVTAGHAWSCVEQLWGPVATLSGKPTPVASWVHLMCVNWNRQYMWLIVCLISALSNEDALWRWPGLRFGLQKCRNSNSRMGKAVPARRFAL